MKEGYLQTKIGELNDKCKQIDQMISMEKSKILLLNEQVGSFKGLLKKLKDIERIKEQTVNQINKENEKQIKNQIEKLLNEITKIIETTLQQKTQNIDKTLDYLRKREDEINQQAEIIIDVLDHTIATLSIGVPAQIGKSFLVFFRSDHRAVGSIGGNISEKRRTGFMLFFDPAQSRFKENVRAESFGLNQGIVMQNYIVEVAAVFFTIRRKVGTTAFVRLTDTAGTMDKHFTKATIVRLIGVFVSQMPLTENTRLVAALSQQLREGRC